MVVLEWQRFGLFDGGQHGMPHRDKRCRDETKLHQRKLVRVCAAVDSLLRTRISKDPYPLDRAEVMVHLRDVVRQSDESDRSEVQQHEPSCKKDS